ncbi:MAG: lipoate--protein ligase family protein [Sphaerobacteraceae bacterium]|nr:MAG: lipoate--protein ligase family protein [Sphaerobacteraceae bacterium]
MQRGGETTVEWEHHTGMQTADTTIRLIDLSFADGARQLAISEAIMRSTGRGESPPTIRLYSWSEPVVILGVGQPASDLNLDLCRERGYRVLRRIGGGTAVYHDAEEVSIDMIVPAGHRLGPTDVHRGYDLFSQMLSLALRQQGIEAETVTVEKARAMSLDESMRPVCFASISPFEFLHDGRKLDGICQIRRKDAIAYQAAIYNRFPIDPIIDVIIHETDGLREHRRSQLERFATDLATAKGETVDYRELQRSVANAASECFDATVTLGELTSYELEETEQLISEKYASDDWTYRR